MTTRAPKCLVLRDQMGNLNEGQAPIKEQHLCNQTVEG